MSESPRQVEDETLVARMVAGDESALGDLYDRHAGGAFAIAYAITGNRSDAEEAVSDAFVQCWTQAERFDAERGTVAAWLHTMVRSRAYDRARTIGRHTRLTARAGQILASSGAHESDSGAVPPTLASVSPAPDPERATRASRASSAVHAALARLPEEQRRAIELAWLADMSHSEIAAETGTPLGTVKTRIRSGMGKLRDALRAYGEQGEP